MQIVPAIDIFEGKCVRLAEGEFSRKSDYNIIPADKAREFQQAGAQRLHVVDLEGAKEGKVVNWDALTAVLAVEGLDTQVGGGIRSVDDIRRLLDLGASRVVIGSMAVTSPELVGQWVGQFGGQKFCIALDVKDGFVATRGWQDAGSSPIDDVVRPMAKLGVKDFLSTDIRRDGMLSGPNVQMYADLALRFPELRWLASGGVRSLVDLTELATTGVAGVIIGKALYEQKIDLAQLFRFAC